MERPISTYLSSGNMTKVWEFVLRLSRDPSIAEHIVEQTYMQLSKYEYRSPPDSSALVTLFAQAYSLWSSRFRRPALARNKLRRRPLANQPEVGSVLEAIERLPEVQRMALMLVTVEKFTYAEVATVLDQSVEIVVTSLSQARATVDADCFAAR